VLSFVILGYCAALASVAGVFRLLEIWPGDPWEAGIVVEGWRAFQKMPVYEPSVTGHATLMYGPAHPLLLGFLFNFVPVSKFIPEILSLASALGLVGLFILAFRPFCSINCCALIGLSAFAIDIRVQHFADGHSDLLAWFLGFVGLASFYLYEQKRSYWYYLSAVALMVAGFAFKQPVAMLALVPPLAQLFYFKSTPTLADRILSCGPLAAIGLLVFFIYVRYPDVYHYMIVVPRAWPILWDRWPKTIWSILAGAACVWFALGFAFSRLSYDGPTRRLIWWAVLAAITLPLSALTSVKLGGSPNSLLPGFISLIGLSWELLASRGSLQRLDNNTAGLLLVMSFCLALMVMPELSSIPSSINYYWSYTTDRNEKYREVIRYVKTLNGVIYSPEDPTIVLYAKQRATRSIYLEYDALVEPPPFVGWPTRLPDYLRTEFSHADYIVTMVGQAPKDLLQGSDLLEMGFRRIWSNGDYEVWTK
jgi:hypothetical protein